MAVIIAKTFRVDEPVEKVWALLSDPRKVATCVPGAQITEQVDDKTYKGAIKVKVGPSTNEFKGELQVLRLDAQTHDLEILGKGQDVRGKGSASMKMTGKLQTVDGGTEVVSSSELTVVGILAQMGARVITEVSNIMFEQFVNNFKKQLQAPDGATVEAAKPIGGVGLAFSALKASFSRHDEKSDNPEAAKPSGDPSVK
jgi:carbon monoxide dehydrogenase subunit G